LGRAEIAVIAWRIYSAIYSVAAMKTDHLARQSRSVRGLAANPGLRDTA
jgi:hypothetical protein